MELKPKPEICVGCGMTVMTSLENGDLRHVFNEGTYCSACWSPFDWERAKGLN